MTAKVAQHAWSAEALFSKALLFVEEMEEYTAEDWPFGLWASLSLEMVARASLSQISPTLLANRKDWRNIHHALGHPVTAIGFVPNSVTTSEVLSILKELVPEFTESYMTRASRIACVETQSCTAARRHLMDSAPPRGSRTTMPVARFFSNRWAKTLVTYSRIRLRLRNLLHHCRMLLPKQLRKISRRIGTARSLPR